MSPRAICAGLVAALAISAPVRATEPCADADKTLTDARKQNYAPLIAKSMGAKVKPSKVVMDDFLQKDDWIVIGAEVPVADGEGYFLFQKQGGELILHDVWGGYAEPSEADEIAAWARQYGAPEDFAACFASVVVGG